MNDQAENVNPGTPETHMVAQQAPNLAADLAVLVKAHAEEIAGLNARIAELEANPKVVTVEKVVTIPTPVPAYQPPKPGEYREIK